MKLLIPLLLAVAILLSGCVTAVEYGPQPPPGPEPVVYYGWYGSYYGYYYWDGPAIVFGCPPLGWHGWNGHYHFYGGPRYYYHPGFHSHR